jgi:hypothetical protein
VPAITPPCTSGNWSRRSRVSLLSCSFDQGRLADAPSDAAMDSSSYSAGVSGTRAVPSSPGVDRRRETRRSRDGAAQLREPMVKDQTLSSGEGGRVSASREASTRARTAPATSAGATTKSVDRPPRSKGSPVETPGRLIPISDRATTPGGWARTSRDRLIQSADRARKSGDRVKKSRDRLTQSRDRLIQSADWLTQSADRLRKSADWARKSRD